MLGLIDLLERYRYPVELEAPVVAIPDVRPAIERADLHARGALHAADIAHLIADAIDDTDADHERLAAAVAEAEAHVAGLHAAARVLATVLLGCAAQQPDSDAVHLVDHVVACAVERLSDGVLLSDEQPEIIGRTEAELLTEVAGYVSRLLCEAPARRPWSETRKVSRLTLHPHAGAGLLNYGRGAVHVYGDADGIAVHFQGTELVPDAATLSRIAGAGWPDGSITDVTPAIQGIAAFTRFVAPVTVSEVAQLVVRTLVDLLDASDLADATRFLGEGHYCD